MFDGYIKGRQVIFRMRTEKEKKKISLFSPGTIGTPRVLVSLVVVPVIPTGRELRNKVRCDN